MPGLRGLVLSKCFLPYRENTVYLISLCLQIIRLSEFLLCTLGPWNHILLKSSTPLQVSVALFLQF